MQKGIFLFLGVIPRPKIIPHKVVENSNSNRKYGRNKDGQSDFFVEKPKKKHINKNSACADNTELNKSDNAFFIFRVRDNFQHNSNKLSLCEFCLQTCIRTLRASRFYQNI